MRLINIGKFAKLVSAPHIVTKSAKLARAADKSVFLRENGHCDGG